MVQLGQANTYAHHSGISCFKINAWIHIPTVSGTEATYDLRSHSVKLGFSFDDKVLVLTSMQTVIVAQHANNSAFHGN